MEERFKRQCEVYDNTDKTYLFIDCHTIITHCYKDYSSSQSDSDQKHQVIGTFLSPVFCCGLRRPMYCNVLNGIKPSIPDMTR